MKEKRGSTLISLGFSLIGIFGPFTLTSAENIPDVRLILREALESVKGSQNPIFQDHIYDEIAAVQVQIGDQEGALQTAKRRGELNSATLKAISKSQLEKGDIEGALRTAAFIKDDWVKADTYRLIAEKQIETGQQASAKEALQNAVEGFINSKGMFKVWSLTDIAELQAKAGFIDEARTTLKEALQVAKSNQGTDHDALDLSFIAQGQATIGDIQAALHTAAAIKDEDHRQMALRNIATAQAKAGKVSESLATISSITDDFQKGFALQELASEQAKFGDLQGAMQTIDTIPSNLSKAIALEWIGDTQHRAGDLAAATKTFRQAATTAQEIQDKNEKARTLASIAMDLANVDDVEHARDAIGQTLKTVHSIDNQINSKSILLDTVEAQTKVGDMEGARKTADMLRDDFFRPKALHLIAVAQARAGNYTGALHTANDMQKDFLKAVTLGDIAKIQAGAGDINGALAWAKHSSPDDKSSALLGVVEGILKGGHSKN
jgi:tetratricopeptide (TPR) repeat protein